MAYNNVQGSKYEATKDLNRAELKKLMLADLKAAGLPKGVRVTLREGRGSFSLTATIAGFKGILNPERVKHDEENPHEFVPEFRCPRFTEEATTLAARIICLLEAYNYDKSEIETDYFNVRFYLHVEFKREDERAELAALIIEARGSAANVAVQSAEPAQVRFMREAGAL